MCALSFFRAVSAATSEGNHFSMLNQPVVQTKIVLLKEKKHDASYHIFILVVQ
jgi:hypothetical protein